MGTSQLTTFLTDLGRCCRLGQDPVLFFAGNTTHDAQEEVARLMRDKRMTATKAMTQIDAGRPQSKKQSGRD
jgi:hypothetical protein